MKHDLLFYENRSTPKVVDRGAKFEAPETYGKFVSRRAASDEEEKIIARNDWLRVDAEGRKPADGNYKKTKMVGREHLLVKHGVTEDPEEPVVIHFGVKGMRWGHRKPGTRGGTPASSRTKGSGPRLTADQKAKAKKAGLFAAGGLAAVGIVAGAAVLNKNGNLPVGSLKLPSSGPKLQSMPGGRKTPVPGPFTPRPNLRSTSDPRLDAALRTYDRATRGGEQAAKGMSQQMSSKTVKDFSADLKRESARLDAAYNKTMSERRASESAATAARQRRYEELRDASRSAPRGSFNNPYVL